MPGRTTPPGSPLCTTEGTTWLLGLSPTGARPLASSAAVDERLHGSASGVLLTLHGRLPPDGLRTDGDRAVLQRFLDRPSLD
ncbi:hypothetical protein OHS59_03580 [Streptomyces sp. NBC_00414]|uniref:hypothetical protein n=1 Tax=Streptomyces sp. NBC_00414 TaxID=2975739 RepID=UPI002E1D98A5